MGLIFCFQMSVYSFENRYRPKIKASLSNAFILGLLKFASLTRTDVDMNVLVIANIK